MSEFDERMEALRGRFAERIAEDRAALGAALDGFDKQRISDLAHRLAGSGGLFGYPEISRLASQVEDRIDNGNDAEIRDAAVALLDLLIRNDQPR